MKNFFKGLISTVLKVPKWVFRALVGQDQTAQAMFIRIVAEDLLRQYMAHNPKTGDYLHAAYDIITQLMQITGVSQAVATRVAEAAAQRLTVTEGK